MGIYHAQNQYRHYTYLIIVDHNVPDEPRKYYIGSRTVKGCTPEEDIKYLGSSKRLNQFLKEHPDAKVTKAILACFSTSKEALAHEIQLHEEIDVARNPLYFNLSNQKSTGFSTAGTMHSDEAKQKISEKLKGRSPSNKGRPRSKETKQKISEKLKGRSPSNKGMPCSEETKRKLSEKMKGRPGRPRSEEFKRNISKITKDRPMQKIVCRTCDRKEYRACDVTKHGLNKLGLV